MFYVLIIGTVGSFPRRFSTQYTFTLRRTTFPKTNFDIFSVQEIRDASLLSALFVHRLPKMEDLLQNKDFVQLAALCEQKELEVSARFCSRLDIAGIEPSPGPKRHHDGGRLRNASSRLYITKRAVGISFRRRT